MLTASCLVMVPARSCATSKVCNSLWAGDLRRAARSASTRQARRFGIQSKLVRFKGAVAKAW